ncbi:MAG: hypothetical protein ACR2GT_07475 [Gaiellaceae bacterium]
MRLRARAAISGWCVAQSTVDALQAGRWEDLGSVEDGHAPAAATELDPGGLRVRLA